MACAVEGGPTQAATATAPIVYGEDDRVDLFQAEEPFVTLGRELAIALMAPEALWPVAEGGYAVEAPSLGALQSLCAGERFADQTAAASCSGVLVAPGVVATAGHCLGVEAEGQPDCRNNLYVRGYAVLELAAPVTVAEEEVYGCGEVLALARSAADSACHVDLALVGLERTPPVEEPPVLRDVPVEADEPVTVIGYPAGLPVKVDSGARVVDPRSGRGDSFTLSSDTFAVSSGAGVFDRAGALVGVFARGRPDYDADGDCQRVHREPEHDAAGYEEAAQIAVVRELLTAVERRDRYETFELFPGSSICSVTATVYPATASSDASPATAATDGCALGALPPRGPGGPLALLVLLALTGVRLRRHRRPVHGTRTVEPWVARDSRARWASAAAARGKRWPTVTRTAPARITSKSAAALARSSSRVAT